MKTQKKLKNLKNPSKNLSESEIMMRELKKIAEGIGKTLAPFCEVVLHDLQSSPPHIAAIHTPLSGRALGDSTTEMGYARINNADFPDLIINYENQFSDGRPVKSTSIGIRNSQGKVIASLCLNLNISNFISIRDTLEQLCTIRETAPVEEKLSTVKSTQALKNFMNKLAHEYNKLPHELSILERRQVIARLQQEGYFSLRGAVPQIAQQFNVSRATVYSVLNTLD